MIKSYKDLTLSQFDKISDTLNSDAIDSEKDLEILSILSGYSVKDIRSFDMDVVTSMIDDAKFLQVPMKEIPVGNTIKYNGTVYKVCKYLTYGQYIDFESAKSMTEILSIVLVPKGLKYGDDYEVDFSNMNCEEAISIVNFFIHGLKNSILHSLRYSQIILMFKPKLSRLISSLRSLVKSIPTSLFYQQ